MTPARAFWGSLARARSIDVGAYARAFLDGFAHTLTTATLPATLTFAVAAMVLGDYRLAGLLAGLVAVLVMVAEVWA